MCKCKIAVIFLSVVMLVSMSTGFSVTATTETEENLFQNGSFEEAINPNGDWYTTIPGWTAVDGNDTASSAAYSLSAAEKVTGDKSLKISAKGTAQAYIQQDYKIPENRRNEYFSVSFYVKSTTGGRIRYKINESDSYAGFYNPGVNVDFPIGEWVRKSFVVQPRQTDGLLRIYIALWLSSASETEMSLYVDHVVVKPIDDWVKNGDVEEFTVSSGKKYIGGSFIAGHEVNGETVSVGSQYAYEGLNGIRIAPASGAPSFSVAMGGAYGYSSAVKPLNPGDVMLLSWYVRSDVGTAYRKHAYSIDANNKATELVESGYNTIVRVPSTNGLWKKMEHYFTVPATCGQITVDFYTYSSSGAEVYADYDNISLKKVKTNVRYSKMVDGFGEKQITDLTPGLMNINVAINENTTVTPFVITCLYEKNGDVNVLRDVKMGTITENNGVKTSTIENVAIPSENTNDYFLATYIIDSSTLKPFIPQVVLQ